MSTAIRENFILPKRQNQTIKFLFGKKLTNEINYYCELRKVNKQELSIMLIYQCKLNCQMKKYTCRKADHNILPTEHN